MIQFISKYLPFIVLINAFALHPTRIVAQNRIAVKDTTTAFKLEKLAIDTFGNDKMATIVLLQQALVLRKAINFGPKIATNLWSTAFVYYDQKNYNTALTYLAQARKYDATNHRIDNLCGQIYRIRGEYVLAKQAFLRAIQQAFANGNYDKAIEFHLDAVRICTELNELDTAIIIAKNAIKLSKDPLANGPMYINVGNIYKDKNEWNKALAMYKVAIKTAEKLHKKLTNIDLIIDNLRHQSTTFANTGVVYRKQKNYAQALFYTKKCLEVRQKIQDITALAESYSLMADIYTLQKNYTKAHEYYNNSIRLLCPDFALQQQNRVLPSFAALRNAPRNVQLLVQLSDKITCLNQENGSLATIKAYHLLDDYIDLLRKEQISADTKLFWRENVRGIYQDAIALCYKLKKNDEAFYFFEKSRAVLLLEAISSQTTPISLANFNKKCSPNTAYIAFFVLTENENEEREKGKSALNVTPKSPISNLQSPNTDSCFVISVFNQKITLQKLPYDAILIQQYAKNLQTKNENAVFEQGFLVYKMLIKPLNLPANIKNIIVSPDGILHKIPFEALLTQNTNAKAKATGTAKATDFLLAQYAISYTYSATLLQQSFTPKKATNSILAFAPVSFQRFGFADLLQTEKSAENLAKAYNGVAFLEKNATKNSFLKAAPAYHILQLFTHAQASDAGHSEPKIYFADSVLTLSELQKQKLNADLAVLTACETGAGTIVQGEGVMSLARGFAQAGVPATISTLWSVPLKASVFITEAFYKHLAAGLPKDAALRQAKLDYLNAESGHTEQIQPYFWAAPLLYGNTNAVEISTANGWFWVAIAALFAIIVFCCIRFNFFHYFCGRLYQLKTSF